MFYCDARNLAPGEFKEALLLDEAIEFEEDFKDIPYRWMTKFGKGIRSGYEPKSKALRDTYREYIKVRKRYENLIKDKKFKNLRINNAKY
jgi:hypothetical protein